MKHLDDPDLRGRDSPWNTYKTPTCAEETRRDTHRRLRPAKKSLAVQHLNDSDLRGRDSPCKHEDDSDLQRIDLAVKLKDDSKMRLDVKHEDNTDLR